MVFGPKPRAALRWPWAGMSDALGVQRKMECERNDAIKMNAGRARLRIDIGGKTRVI